MKEHQERRYFKFSNESAENLKYRRSRTERERFLNELFMHIVLNATAPF